MQDKPFRPIYDAAIEAEYETGVREETEEKARAHVIVRLARMTVGTLVVIAGIVLLPLPGPGWLIIAAGLAILAQDVVWADRLLKRVRARLPADEDGGLPRSTIITMVIMGVISIAGAIWWTFLR